MLAVGDKRIVGMEGLIRWRHPQARPAAAGAFLPTAEQNNLMREVGLWAIRRALDDRIELGIDDKDEMSVSVNVSPRQLGEDGFLAQLNSLLAERSFPPRLLRLELTENALIDNSNKTVALLGDLRRLGIQVIIDNFGTGYASLSYLRNLPVAGLKIDHTFVRDLQADRGNAAIVQAIMTLAGKLGLQVIAEGVETGAEMRALSSFDCDHDPRVLHLRAAAARAAEGLPADGAEAQADACFTRRRDRSVRRGHGAGARAAVRRARERVARRGPARRPKRRASEPGIAQRQGHGCLSFSSSRAMISCCTSVAPS